MFRKNVILNFILIAGLCAMMLQFYGCSGMIKANHLIAQEKYDEAIPFLQEQIAEHPDSVQAKNRLGFAYLKTGRMDEAIQEFEDVLKLSPGEPEAVLYLGMAYLNKEELDKAVDTWQGYRNEKAPLVEEEINRLMTILLIAQSQHSAKTAIAQESQLNAKKAMANSIAVCYFNDLSADKSLGAFQKGLAAMVTTDLSKLGKFQVVERLRLQALLQEMKLGQTGIVDPSTAPRIGKLLGTETLVTGNLSLGSIRVVTSLSSSSREKVVGSANIRVAQEDFYNLPGQIIQNCADILGIKLTAMEQKAIQVPHTKAYKAFIHYGQAIDALDAGKWQDAKNFFEMALKADPNFDLAKTGSDSCPGPSAPSVNAISAMTVSNIAQQANVSVSTAEQAQESANAESSGAGGFGGSDSDGGGGGSY